jgi:protease I
MTRANTRCAGIGAVAALLAATILLSGATPGWADEKPLEGKRVLFLVGEGFHDGETFFPMGYLAHRGAKITVAGVSPAEVTAYNSDATVNVEKAVSEISVDRYDAMVIPGGRSPANLRQYGDVVEFAGKFFESGKPVAAICHGPQVLVTAEVLEGYEATCVASISGEIEGAGATYRDEAMVRDRNLITSRLPGDLPDFVRAIEDALTE